MYHIDMERYRIFCYSFYVSKAFFLIPGGQFLLSFSFLTKPALIKMSALTTSFEVEL